MRISAENIKNYDIYPSHVIQQDNKKQVGIYLYEMVKNVCRYYSDNTEDDEKGIFKNVIAYIDEHYMEKLSLDEVADSASEIVDGEEQKPYGNEGNRIYVADLLGTGESASYALGNGYTWDLGANGWGKMWREVEIVAKELIQL